MRFAITGCDNSLGVFESFLQAGWEPVKLFTFSTEDSLESNRQIIDLAQSNRINVQLSRMTGEDLRELGQRGCEVLVVSGYKWRIGDWRPHLRYAVNFHPSPLPEARGPYPLVRAIMDGRRLWAVSCHKVENDFDTGAILANEMLRLDAMECHERLSLRIQMASMRLAERVAKELVNLWNAAQPQGAGDYWPSPSREDRTIDFFYPVASIMQKVRALGLLGCLARVNDVWICAKRVVGWEEEHTHLSGSVVHINNQSIVVAASDGYIGIIEWILVTGAPSKVAVK